MATPTIKAVVLDIEGTTTPISFVSETLFPYISRELETYLRKNWNDETTKKDVELLRDLASQDKVSGVKDVVEITGTTEEELQESVIKNVRWQMSSNRKSTALKSLQGHMWRTGYENGELRGRVYEDVVESLQRWQKANVPVYIYSSGSIEAQKLLFGFTESGDLIKYLKGHFDTTTGPKIEASSYTSIASSIGVEPKNVLFLTDLYQEAVAASQAQFHVCISVRPGNQPLPADNPFPTVSDFTTLFPLYQFNNTI
eukprot:Phypoly_transcript_16489.p1 GENE.Phypoly_transcript_16489~~Phypoly_transcript_16489.p1  ORF type:complete len:256 (+),score=37.89 Phypoly_transcript_16489:90-857(+)